MNIITLIPIKNEEAILETTLLNASKFSDFIIVADQHSTDRSREIAATFKKVRVITNDNDGHSNKVRWQLLDEARKIPGTNLMVVIDADEMISPQWFESIKNKYTDVKSAIGFSFKWIQLWNSTDKYRVDGVWKNSRKTAVWLDDRTVDYDRKEVINDHTTRVPENIPLVTVKDFPLLHFQFLFGTQTELKQVWYMVNEFVKTKGKNARKINYTYSNSRPFQKAKTEPVSVSWFEDIDMPNLSENSSSWHMAEIQNLFDHYGVDYFEPLDIWYLSELRERFTKAFKRDPKPQTYPTFLISLNNIKNKFK